MDFKIEQIGIHEMLRLMEISEETFRDTFAHTTSKENMDEFVEEAYDFYQLKDEIADRNSLFFFVYRGDEVLGYMKLNINEAQTEQIVEDALEIERIYVRKPYHRQGIGKALYEKAIEMASILNTSTIWLGVYEHNENAKAFYQRLGFEEIGSHSFYIGNDEQRDLIMSKSLSHT